MAKLYIDGKVHDVEEGKNILEVCLSLGYDLPYFCWHPALGSVGSCRQCAVMKYKDENDEQGKLSMACMEPVTDETRISIKDTTSTGFRKNVVEWLMTNHPHDCPVCDEGGECHLQDMTVMTGHAYRRFNFNKRTYKNQYLGPFINHEMNRCIQCYRCVRFYKDYAGGDDLDVFAAHNHVYFGRYKDGVLQNEFSGNLVEICPTGVFTDKTLKKHYTRKWDLKTAPSICTHCSLGCNTIAGERYGSLRRILSRYNHEVNGYFLCDRGRFGYEFTNSPQRVNTGIYTEKEGRTLETKSKYNIKERLEELISGRGSLIGVGSPRASVESNFLLKSLVGESNFYAGVGKTELSLIKKIQSVLKNSPVPTASLKKIRDADAVVMLGEDVTNTAPMMALAVRQAAQNKPAAQAEKLKIPLWNDTAVRELIQDEKGPVVVATPNPTKLDSISSMVFRNNSIDIARIGFSIAAAIDSGAPDPDLDEETKDRIQKVVSDLMDTRNPVIISGISLMDKSVIEAAFNIALALYKKEKNCSIAFVLPESNSLGLGMLSDRSFDDYKTVNSGKKETVIVLENDLSRRFGPEALEMFEQERLRLIVLDSLMNRTVEASDCFLPAGTFAETNGTFINNEGRGQRYFKVYEPEEPVMESWRWLIELSEINNEDMEGVKNFDEVLQNIVSSEPELAKITECAPLSDYRKNDQKIPREPTRYSGRTAMHANKNVNEPRTESDPDSPFSFSMEGYKGQTPSTAVPFFWSPGWNSEQAINKFQIEIGGPLQEESPGVILLEKSDDGNSQYFTDIPDSPELKEHQLLAEPAYHIFGSGELSSYAESLSELIPEKYIGISKKSAEKAGLSGEEDLELMIDSLTYKARIRIMENIAPDVIMIPAGIDDLPVFWENKIITIKNKTE